MTAFENLPTNDDPARVSLAQDEPESRFGGLPLYVWVIVAVLLAIPTGVLWGE